MGIALQAFAGQPHGGRLAIRTSIHPAYCCERAYSSRHADSIGLKYILDERNVLSILREMPLSKRQGGFRI
jgi:hypothetical protein